MLSCRPVDPSTGFVRSSSSAAASTVSTTRSTGTRLLRIAGVTCSEDAVCSTEHIQQRRNTHCFATTHPQSQKLHITNAEVHGLGIR